MKLKSRVKPAGAATPLRTVAQKQKEIFVELDALAKTYGAEVFRIAGQRYFKRQREEAALRAEIVAREHELERLRTRRQ